MGRQKLHQQEAFDFDAGYYGEEEPVEDYGETSEDPYELAEQYDHAYATYLGARQRFQQLKLAQGYLPVVALTDGQPSSPMASSSTSKGKDRSPSKGKSKHRNKGKGKNVIRYPPNMGGKPADPRGRAQATTCLTCLRCGQPGHWAAQCPQSARPSSTATRRPAPGPTEGMAAQAEQALVLFQHEHGDERPDATMLDQCWILVPQHSSAATAPSSATLTTWTPWATRSTRSGSLAVNAQFHFGGGASSQHEEPVLFAHR